MMKRVVAVIACGLSLSACESMNMSMPSMDIFKSAPVTTEVRVDSEPAGGGFGFSRMTMERALALNDWLTRYPVRLVLN